LRNDENEKESRKIFLGNFFWFRFLSTLSLDKFLEILLFFSLINFFPFSAQQQKFYCAFKHQKNKTKFGFQNFSVLL
jgi:hypothetical protein